MEGGDPAEPAGVDQAHEHVADASTKNNPEQREGMDDPRFLRGLTGDQVKELLAAEKAKAAEKITERIKEQVKKKTAAEERREG